MVCVLVAGVASLYHALFRAPQPLRPASKQALRSSHYCRQPVAVVRAGPPRSRYPARRRHDLAASHVRTGLGYRVAPGGSALGDRRKLIYGADRVAGALAGRGIWVM